VKLHSLVGERIIKETALAVIQVGEGPARNLLPGWIDSVEDCQRTGTSREAAPFLLMAARLLVQTGNFEPAARLAGLSFALSRKSEYCPGESESRQRWRLVMALQTALGAKATTKALAAGAKMSLPGALDLMRKVAG
jgi:hypothetical protein